MAEPLAVPQWAPGAKFDVHQGVLPWDASGAWKVALLGAGFFIGPGLTHFAQVSGFEITASGYPAGGLTLSGTSRSATGSSGLLRVTADTEVSPAASLAARWACVYHVPSGRIAFFVQAAVLWSVSSPNKLILDWGNDRAPADLGTWIESTLFGAIGAYTDNSQANWNAWETFLGRDSWYKPQYPVGANIASFTGMRTAIRGILNPAQFPRTGGMVIVLMVPYKHSGQSFAQVATTDVNRAEMEGVGQDIENSGVAAPRGDGRASLIIIPGQELNGSGYFQTQPQNDTDALHVATAHEKMIGWIRSQIRPEHRMNVKFALSFVSRTGPPAARLQKMLAPSIDLIDGHIFDDEHQLYPVPNQHLLTPAAIQAAKDAVEDDVWDRLYNGTQGLKAHYDLAVANDLPFMVNEFGIQTTSNNGNTGGGDHPTFIHRFFDFVEAFPLPDGRLVCLNYTQTNSSASGQFHNKLGTGEFPLATAAYLERAT